MSRTYDIISSWYHSYLMISSLVTRWRWLGAPRAPRSSSAGVAIANVLQTSVELNGDRLDPSAWFGATLAAHIVSGGKLIVLQVGVGLGAWGSLSIGNRKGGLASIGPALGHLTPLWGTSLTQCVLWQLWLLLLLYAKNELGYSSCQKIICLIVHKIEIIEVIVK